MPLLLLSIPFLLGLTLLILGLHGRRISTHPHCRKCKFDLQGLPSATNCPECGSDLSRPKAITNGLRRRTPIPFWSGTTILSLALLVAALVFATVFLGTTANPYKPVWLLSLELTGPRDGKANAASNELVTRLRAGKLSQAAVGKLVTGALDRQADITRPWRTGWGDIIEAARAAKLVSDADWARYARNCVALTIITRETIRVGDPFVVGLMPDSRVAAKSKLELHPSWWITAAPNENNPARVFWDINALRRPLMLTANQRFANGAPPTSHHMSHAGMTDVHGISTPTDVGQATIEFPMAFIVVDPAIPSFPPTLLVPPNDDDRAADAMLPGSATLTPPPNTVALWKQPIRVTVNVVPRDTPVMTLNTDPALRDAMHTAAESLRLRIDFAGRSCASTPQNPQHQIETYFGSTPISTAFKLIITDPEHGDLPVHTVRCYGPQTSTGNFICNPGEPPPHLARQFVTVRLIPDVDAAMTTLDFTQIWGEEITLDNVQVLDSITNAGNITAIPSTAKAR